MPTILQQMSAEMADVAEGVGRSLVQIRNGSRGTGAGSIWHRDGLSLTNAHVAGSRALRVTLPDGRDLPARVLAHNKRLDLAALSVDATALPAIGLGDSTLFQPGQLVMAIGHPWAVAGAVAAGVVIGVGAHLPEVPVSTQEWIVASLSLRPSDSGGPMMDAQGRLAGINTMITGPQVAMAVPVHVAKVFLQEALSEQKSVV